MAFRMKAIVVALLLRLSVARREYETKYAGKWPDCSNIQCFDQSTLAEMQASCDGFTQCTGFTFLQDAVGNGCLKQCGQELGTGYDEGPYAYWAPVTPRAEKEPEDLVYIDVR
jgi:hypothetical protein